MAPIDLAAGTSEKLDLNEAKALSRVGRERSRVSQLAAQAEWFQRECAIMGAFTSVSEQFVCKRALAPCLRNKGAIPTALKKIVSLTEPYLPARVKPFAPDSGKKGFNRHNTAERALLAASRP